MGDLNSILLEGSLVADPVVQAADTATTCTMEIVNSTRFTGAEGPTVQQSTLRVMTVGRLAENCADYLRSGRAVRVVGRIVVIRDELWILAEHVEFRPVKRAAA